VLVHLAPSLRALEEERFCASQTISRNNASSSNNDNMTAHYIHATMMELLTLQ
jgi:hypothetical protein